MQSNPYPLFIPRTQRGFTLVELLVVITIIAVLSTIGSMGAIRFIDNGRKVQALSQFRDVGAGMAMYETDYSRAPLPAANRASGTDIVYGALGSPNTNNAMVSVLAGQSTGVPFAIDDAAISEINPRNETYVSLPFAANNKNGVGRDGILYDPWGGQVMMALNALKGTASTTALQDRNGGTNDSLLWTFGYGEYTDSKPRDQSYAFWSYGKDKMKGKASAAATAIVPYGSSGDVVSW